MIQIFCFTEVVKKNCVSCCINVLINDHIPFMLTGSDSNYFETIPTSCPEEIKTMFVFRSSFLKSFFFYRVGIER